MGKQQRSLQVVSSWIDKGCWEETCLRSIEVDQVKLNMWMKPDELYSEYVRLKRSDLRRLQEMQKVSMFFALASRSFEATLRILGVVNH